MKRKKIILVPILFILAGVILSISLFVIHKEDSNETKILNQKNTGWTVKSVDTMKFSRDLALEKLNDPSFDQTINLQIKNIKEIGATHVAISTPYDEKFTPYLLRWVKTARKHNLNVWFRGNFSGWEGWFGEAKNLNREDHIKLMQSFIRNDPDLFENGDIFTPCRECENGGPGDPRNNTSLDGFRQFMIDENRLAEKEFYNINKKITTNYASMNYDVAKLVMDKDTLRKMGNVIVVDHYIDTPQQLSRDIDYLIENKNAQVILGEIGVPIDSIHQNMTEQDQTQWLNQAFNLLSQKKNVIGVNYWVSYGGSSAIFNSDNTPKKAADILLKYYTKEFFD